MSDDPVCTICGERKSLHVKTDKGPFTHPREARGEGTYVQVSPPHLQGGFMPGEDYEMPAVWKFVPAEKTS